MKQTAVKWLVDKILVQQELYTDKEGDWIDNPRIEYVNAYYDHVDLSDFVQEAIEIERQQIIDAVEWGLKYRASGFKAEQYYNETYGKSN